MWPQGLRLAAGGKQEGAWNRTRGRPEAFWRSGTTSRPGTQREYEAWYRGEHLPERVSIPGFRAGWRFRAIAGEPEYFTFYETATPEILFSDAYEARVNDPTPLTRSIMSGVFTNATRALLTTEACWGMLAWCVCRKPAPRRAAERRAGTLPACGRSA